MADKYDNMKPFQIKLECKKAGIDVPGKSTEELKAALREEGGGASKPGKPAKGAKGAKVESSPTKSGKPAKGAKVGGASKGGKATGGGSAPDEIVNAALEAFEALVTELKAEVAELKGELGDLSSSMGETVSEIDDRLKVVEEIVNDVGDSGQGDGCESDGDEGDEGDEGGEDDSDELTEAKETLSEYMDDSGELDITAEHVSKFKKPELQALAVYLGINYPEGGLPKVKKAMAEAVTLALAEDNGEDKSDSEEVPGFEGPDGEQIVAVDESIFDAKAWKKNGEFHGQTLFITDSGNIVGVEVSAGKKDSEGDLYLVAENDDGEKYTLYEIGAEPKSGVGILGFAV